MRRLKKDWISSYLDYSKNTEPRRSYRQWVAISTVASVLQRKVYFQLGSECWYPNFYIILTGPPASCKGTAMRPAREFLDRKGIAIAADESTREKLIKRLYNTSTVRLEDGQHQRFHSAITINASELTVFLKAGDTNMLSMLCKWFECEDKYEYDTITHGMQDIPNIWVNLIGATTPRLLQTALPPNAFGTGLISRMLFICEDNKDRIVIYPTLDERLEEDLMIDLDAIGLLSGQFKVAEGTPDVWDIYTKWVYKMEEDPPIKDQRLLDCNQRQRVHFWKLCMVHSASRGDDMKITIEDAQSSIELLRVVQYKMPMAFAGIGENPLAGVQAQVMTLLMTKKTVHVQELMKMHYQDVTVDQMCEILGTLAAMKFCSYDRTNNIVHYTQED